MLILQHLKTLQYVSIIILIIFRELVDSFLKSLNLKFEIVKGQLWWCCSIQLVCVRGTHTHQLLISFLPYHWFHQPYNSFHTRNFLWN